MKKHIKKEHGENEKEFSEKNAEGKTIALMNNDEIVKTKMKKKKATIACKVYKAFFISRTDLKIHQLDQHSSEKIIACESCTDMFSSKKDLKLHISDIHSGYPFELCGDRFKIKKELKAHKTEKHTVAEEYPCCVCTKQVKKNHLRQHMMNHTTVRELKYSSQECDFRSLTKIGLVVHVNKQQEL